MHFLVCTAISIVGTGKIMKWPERIAWRWVIQYLLLLRWSLMKVTSSRNVDFNSSRYWATIVERRGQDTSLFCLHLCRNLATIRNRTVDGHRWGLPHHTKHGKHNERLLFPYCSHALQQTSCAIWDHPRSTPDLVDRAWNAREHAMGNCTIQGQALIAHDTSLP